MLIMFNKTSVYIVIFQNIQEYLITIKEIKQKRKNEKKTMRRQSRVSSFQVSIAHFHLLDANVLSQPKKEREREKEKKKREMLITIEQQGMKRRRLSLHIRKHINSSRIREVVRKLMATEENLFPFFSFFFLVFILSQETELIENRKQKFSVQMQEMFD